MPIITVFDCESDSKPSRFGDRDLSFDFTQCTCACAITFFVNIDNIKDGTKDGTKDDGIKNALLDGRTLTCWRDDVSENGKGPFEPMFQEFDNADVIVGYNSLDFDFPLLKKHYTAKEKNERYVQHRLKSLDIFSRLRDVLDHWPKLDHLLAANGLAGKTGTGAQAIQLWESGQRDQLCKYCLVDVLQTAQLAMLPSLAVPTVHGTVNVPCHIYGVLPFLVGRFGQAANVTDIS